MQGQLRLEIKYTPLRGPNAQLLPPTERVAPQQASTAEKLEGEAVGDTEGVGEGEGEDEGVGEGEGFTATLATRGLAKGGSEGVDWSTLSVRVGEIGKDENSQFELCCFLTHKR